MSGPSPPPRAPHLRAPLFGAALFGTFALAVALLGAWLLFGRGGTPIQTDLLAMLPATERHPLAEAAVERLAHANGDRMVLVVEHANDSEAKDAARDLGKRLVDSKAFASITAELPPFDLDQLLAPYLPHRFHLLTDADRASLTRPDYDPAQALARRLNEPFLAGVGIKLQDDPFGWLQHWLDQQPWSRSPLVPEDDLLTAHRDDRTYVMVIATLRGSSYDDTVQRTGLSALAQAEQTVLQDHPGTHVLRAGAVFHAAEARAGAEHDVHVVGLTSTLGIAVLLLWAFRSPRPLLIAFLSTAIGIVTAITATVLIFGQMHLLTLVFGAALLGEAVDYSIQYLCARANAGATWQAQRGVRQVRPALLLALATSLLGYALLGGVPFPALRQMACFAMVGMLAACLSVFWLLPALLAKPASKPLSPSLVGLARRMQNGAARLGHGRYSWIALALLVLVALPGWWRLGHDDDIHLLISPPADLAREEARIRDITGLGNSSQFYLVHGDSAEQVLQREEALEAHLQTLVQQGRMDSWTGIAGMLPSAQRQQANHAALAPLFADHALMEKQLLHAGLRDNVVAAYLNAWPGQPLSMDAWLAMPVSTPFRYLWMGQSEHGFASIVLPQGQDDANVLRTAAEELPGVELVDKPASISALFGRYRTYASLWLSAALVLVALVFVWRYGRAAPRVIAPPLLGIGLTLTALGYLGEPLTLFHWMALMLVLGVGANYAVFLHEGEPHAAHVPGATYAGVLLSAVTALLSFGLLALSSMPALQHFGITLLLGIGFTALLVPVTRPAREYETV
ncbi:MMPL family transporter [Dyella subtropica]|uniref:MMPL family transporter n=1 Tax=Dyella subtropica TaxID=2992127 RepID=UPI00225960C9|nr:MMPL family transporter [Dyella subtropica]